MPDSLIEKTAEMLQKKFEHEHTGHDWFHIFRVWQMARRIAISEKADLQTVELAALLHDLADWKEHNGNYLIGEQAAAEWLEKNHADSTLIQKVCEAIRHVSYKGPTTTHVPPTLEGKIVQDADRLDAIGAIGMIRAISFGASKERILYDPAILPKTNMNQEEFSKRTINPKDDTTINHFYEKLLLVKDRLNTKTAREIATGRHTFMERFLEQFYAEWNANDAKSV